MTPTTIRNLAALLIAVLGSCPAIADEKLTEFLLNKNYEHNLPPDREWLIKPRKEVTFSNGTKAVNCEEYIKARRTSVLRDTKMDLMIGCEYAACIALEQMQLAKPHNGYRPESHTSELLNRLDLRSFYNAPEGDLDSPDKHTLADLNDSNIKLVGDREIFRQVDNLWLTRFFIFSDADLNGNGEPDWIFMGTEKALDVPYLECNVFVIYDVKPTGLLKAVGYPFDPPK